LFRDTENMNETAVKQFLSIGEASEYLGVSIDTLRRWTRAGKISDSRSPGGHRYFKKDDLDNLFNTKYERYKEPTESDGINSTEATADVKSINIPEITEIQDQTSIPALPQSEEIIESKVEISPTIINNPIQTDEVVHTQPKLIAEEITIETETETIVEVANETIETIAEQKVEQVLEARDTRPTNPISVPTSIPLSIKAHTLITRSSETYAQASTPILIPTVVGDKVASKEEDTVSDNNKKEARNLKKILLIIFGVFILADLLFIILWYATPNVISPIQ
jgi:excisionase family DNA binding protein